LYGVIEPKTESHINISITNLREEYMKKLIMTGLIGYLYRMIGEYKDYTFDDKLKKSSELSEEDLTKIFREQIENFIKRNFEYNPDYHVRSAKVKEMGDPERLGKYKEMRQKMHIEQNNNVNNVKYNIKDMMSKLDKLEKQGEDVSDIRAFLRETDDNANLVHDKCDELRQTMKKMRSQIQNDELDKNDLLTIFAKHDETLIKIMGELCQYESLSCREHIKGTMTWIPPVNVYHHFERYVTNHYEQLREAVRILYNDKPDFEFAIQYYDTFDSLEKARDHRIKYENQIVTSIHTLKNGAWTMLGPFEQNRDRIDYYNKNTEILKKMVEQMESDQKLGAEIMKDRVKIEKKKNIAHAGPDDPKLEKYAKAVGTIEKLGSKSILTNEEKEKLKEAKTVKEMAEVPEDAVQTYVHSVNEEGKMETNIMYTKADTVNERGRNSKDESKSKQLKSKSGKVTSLSELKNQMGK
jgi:hypothetical protein